MKHKSPVDFKNKRVNFFKNLPDDEQELVRMFFDHKNHGFYMDIGANEPIIESQTYHLEKLLGWDGLLIEPLPFYVEKLSQERKGKVVQCACSAPENHNQKLKLLVAGGHSTLNPDPIAVGTTSSEYAEVLCKTLDSVLEEHQVPLNFDFISIDIEGHEMEMFKGFSLRKWQPKLVLLEDHVINYEKHNFMTSMGYQLIMRTGLNSWYVPNSLGYKLSVFAKLQFFRKYYVGILARKLRYRR